LTAEAKLLEEQVFNFREEIEETMMECIEIIRSAKSELINLGNTSIVAAIMLDIADAAQEVGEFEGTMTQISSATAGLRVALHRLQTQVAQEERDAVSFQFIITLKITPSFVRSTVDSGVGESSRARNVRKVTSSRSKMEAPQKANKRYSRTCQEHEVETIRTVQATQGNQIGTDPTSRYNSFLAEHHRTLC
jgi:phage shock protein A